MIAPFDFASLRCAQDDFCIFNSDGNLYNRAVTEAFGTSVPAARRGRPAGMRAWREKGGIP